MEPQKFVILTGLSGAGKSSAIRFLEDEGFFCVDNLPPALIPKFAELCAASSHTRMAMVVDMRGREFLSELESAVAALTPLGIDPRVVFFEASDAVLVRRFSETRRRHPLLDEGGVLQAIARERDELQNLKALATSVLDTSELTPNQLRGRLRELLELEATSSGVRVHVLSFGFKHGLPPDVDLVFDMRFVPNPFYVPELRPLSGLDAPVRNFVLEKPEIKEFLERVEPLLLFLLPRYQAEGKSQVTLGFGCTGGQHRSVAVSERVARDLRRSGFDISVQHRDVERTQHKAVGCP